MHTFHHGERCRLRPLARFHCRLRSRASSSGWRSRSSCGCHSAASTSRLSPTEDRAETARPPPQPWLRGIIFFRWSEPVIAPVDKSYSPRDKLAECVIAAHWAAADAPVGIDGRPLTCLGGSVTSKAGVSH